MKARIFGEHDEFIPALKKIASESGNDFVFINVDSHSDMALPNNNISIGNFITHLIRNECFSKVLWIKNPHNNDFSDGFYNFKFAWLNDGQFSCDLEDKFYFTEDSFSRSDEIISISDERINSDEKINEVDFEVISDDKLEKSIFSQKKWVLSIDCDFFGSSNPLSKEFSILKSKIGKVDFDKIKLDFYKIKTYEDWIVFKKELIIKKQWEMVKELRGCTNDEYECSDEEIESKIKSIIVFLKRNFRIEQCLGILICTSFFSGYVNKKKCPKIVSILETYMNNLNFFWGKA